jgi:hypothetical protein
MKLTEMVPKESKLKLGEKELTLRPINLSDEIWLEKEFGQDGIQEIFEKVKIEEISRIVFRLLVDDDKLFFKKQNVRAVSEDGEVSTIELGGVALLRAMVHGWDDKLALLNCLLENIGASRPEQEEINDDDKKKEKKE